MKESEGNLFISIFKEDVKGQKHAGRCVVAEPEIPDFRKPKYAIQNEQNRHKNPNNSRNHHDEMSLYIGISKRNK